MNALATALNAAQDVKATRLLTTSHQFPRTPSTFTEDQDKHIKDTVRKLREGWVMRTSSLINADLRTADQSVYNLSESSIPKHESKTNKLHLLLTRINYAMVQDLLDLTKTSLQDYAAYVQSQCEGRVTVHSIADVQCDYPERTKGDPPRLQPLFRMTVVSTPEKRVLNRVQVDEANERIEEWASTAEEGEECPVPRVEPVEGRTFDYETPLVESVECVVGAFTKAIQECRNIRQAQNYVMERLFWPKPALIEAVAGDEAWIGALIEKITTSIKSALEPCETYLECFKQWEQFLNLDVEEYVSSLKHAVPNDEEYVSASFETRLHQTRPWVVASLISSLWKTSGPSSRRRRRGDGVARHAVDAAPSRRDAVFMITRESPRLARVAPRRCPSTQVRGGPGARRAVDPGRPGDAPEDPDESRRRQSQNRGRHPGRGDHGRRVRIKCVCFTGRARPEAHGHHPQSAGDALRAHPRVLRFSG